MMRDCNSCADHKQGQHPPFDCQICLATENLIHWKPMSKPYDELFRLEQSLVPVVKPVPKTALDVQIGGQHYKSLKIQPVEFVAANGLDFFQGNILKYITRRKGDVEKRLEDLNKAKHYIDLYMDFIKKGEIK